MRKSSTVSRTGRIRTRSTERRERQKRELRQTILDAASELFHECGYENFSLRQVAERIGYSATTIYIYFQNKDDLLRTAVQEGFTAFDRRIENVANSVPDPLRRIEALGREYIAFGMEHPSLYRLMFMQRSDFYFMPGYLEDGAVSGGRPRTQSMTTLMQAVQDAMAAGVVRPGDPLITADVLWAGAHGLVSLAISPLMSPDHAQKVIDLLLATLIEGICPQDAAPPGRKRPNH